MKKPIALIMGSKTDLRVFKDAKKIFKEFDLNFHIEVVSAHRTPEKMFDFAKSAKAKGFEVIIAAAGGAAHLPGMVASLTTLPVIGVPVEVGRLKGLDAILSILQMPKGIPVATVALENSGNAALLAIRILALNSPKIEKQLLIYQKSQKNLVTAQNRSFKGS